MIEGPIRLLIAPPEVAGDSRMSVSSGVDHEGASVVLVQIGNYVAAMTPEAARLLAETLISEIALIASTHHPPVDPTH